MEPDEPGPLSRRAEVSIALGFLVAGAFCLTMPGLLYAAAAVLAFALGAVGLLAPWIRRRQRARATAPPETAMDPAATADPPPPPPITSPALTSPAPTSTALSSTARSSMALSADERTTALRHVEALRAAGVWGTDEPDEPGLDAVLHALAETPGPVDHTAVLMSSLEAGTPRALTCVEGQIEQDADAVRAQVAECARITGRDITVADLAVEDLVVEDLAVEDLTGESVRETPAAAAREVTVRASLRVDGEPLTLTYASASKYPAPDLLLALARQLRRGGAPRRLAALDSGDGDIYLAALHPETDLRPLTDRALEEGWRSPEDGWRWLDETAPDRDGDA